MMKGSIFSLTSKTKRHASRGLTSFFLSHDNDEALPVEKVKKELTGKELFVQTQSKIVEHALWKFSIFFKESNL